MIFQITSKFLIVFVRLILGEKGVDEVTGSQREINIRYEFDLKVILKALGLLLQSFLIKFPSNN